MKYNKVIVIGALILLSACSAQRPSDREIARQQELNLAEVKRSELSQVAGRYIGSLKSGADYEQPVVLSLDVRDVPEEKPGEGVDPVLVPKLVGYLRFLYGSEEAGEYSDAPIRSAEYFAAQGRLNLVVVHSQFEDLILNLSVQGKELEGAWNAGSVGAAGTLSLLGGN